METQNHIVTAEPRFDLAVCTQLVRQYLAAQEWRLVEVDDLAAVIYAALAGQVVGEMTGAVQAQIWQRYAAILHDACRQPGTAVYERAWWELGHFLRQQAYQLAGAPEEREDVVQAALADLQSRLSQNGMDAPRAFLVYALNAARRKAIDVTRQRAAVFRGGGQNPLSWEALTEAAAERETAVPSAPPARPGSSERKVEISVSDREIRAQLKAFFRQHLSGEQQVLVADMLFLEGLSPKEIAGLLQKRPHEIRMVKFRILQTLRSLPPAEKQQLLLILGQPEGDENGG